MSHKQIVITIGVALLFATVAHARTIEGMEYIADDGVTYDWIEISQTGTMVLNSWESIDVGFGFEFHSFIQPQMYIQPSGTLSFGGPDVYPYGTGVARISYNSPSYIAACMDQLSSNPLNPLSGVYYQTIGAPGERQTVIQWQDMVRDGGGSATFQAILQEGTNSIKFQYKDMNFQINSSIPGEYSQAVVGVQGSMLSGIPSWLQWGGQTSVPSNLSAVQFDPRVTENPNEISLDRYTFESRVSVNTYTGCHLSLDRLNPDAGDPYMIYPEEHNDSDNDWDDGMNYAFSSTGSSISCYPPDAEYPVGIDAFAEAEARMEVGVENGILYQATLCHGQAQVVDMGLSEYSSTDFEVMGFGTAGVTVQYDYDGEILVTSSNLPEGTEVTILVEGYDENGIVCWSSPITATIGDRIPFGIDHMDSIYSGENSNVQWLTYRVPEPTTIALLSAGSLALLRRKR